MGPPPRVARGWANTVPVDDRRVQLGNRRGPAQRDEERLQSCPGHFLIWKNGDSLGTSISMHCAS